MTATADRYNKYLIVIRKFALLIGFVLLVCALNGSAHDKPSDEALKVKTELVSVPVIVSDRDERYILDLTQA